jgi:cytochrome c-type biogenesis protein CcmH/NrfG
MSDLAAYRMDAYEKRADAADARMQHIEELLTDIRVDLAKKPSSAAIWGILGTMAFVAFAIVAMFVGVLTYLQAFHHG